jgi:DNA-binding transcriptional MocR family regulator
MTQDAPKYLQIARGIRSDIYSGNYEPGDLLPTVEELDAEWEATSPTIMRALGVLEQEDLVRRGVEGWTVSEFAGRMPAVVAVSAVGYTVILCRACGFVWGNSVAFIERRGLEVDSFVDDHRDRHTSGAIVTADESGE